MIDEYMEQGLSDEQIKARLLGQSYVTPEIDEDREEAAALRGQQMMMSEGKHFDLEGAKEFIEEADRQREFMEAGFNEEEATEYFRVK